MDAIVGLPQSGKSTVLRALTGGHTSAGADARGEHIGAVKLPDERLDKLAALVSAKKVTPHMAQLDDLPPLFQRGSPAAGEALSTADTLIHVVRAFHRDDVLHPNGSVDPARDIATFEAELILFDLGVIERRLEKLDITVRSGRPAEREAGEREQALLQRCHNQLDGETPLRAQISDPQDLKALASFGLLSLKPMLILLNIDEADAANADAIERDYSARFSGLRTGVAAVCASLEAELAELSPADAAEFRREMGAGDSPVERILHKIQDLLGLITFYTAGEKETRAWTLARGSTALQAAARIHTDIERGFIRAEVIGADKMLELGSLVEARKVGQLRTEGKQYIVQHGDVINILFNV